MAKVTAELEYINEENKKILKKIDHESRMIISLINISCISDEIRDARYEIAIC